MSQAKSSGVEIQTYQAAKKGNIHCGDSFYVRETDDYLLCVMADGLGSGEHAMKASQAVTDVARLHSDDDVEELMHKCNQAVLNTRGAVVAVLKFYKQTKQFVYSNVGNIKFYLYSPEGALVYPLPVKGFLSGRAQKFQVQRFRYEEGSRFLMHTDGLELKEVKSLFTRTYLIASISQHLQSMLQDGKDDVSYILGSLIA
ncbi:PP2C family serine/threonine-protein phosphatase [Priestia koreensis]|uniref:PP2C family serine/threonine-protein phosphatase n=1 Tax=Priestia koreensis TaxID=284581 RepID=UPI00345A7373